MHCGHAYEFHARPNAHGHVRIYMCIGYQSARSRRDCQVYMRTHDSRRAAGGN